MKRKKTGKKRVSAVKRRVLRPSDEVDVGFGKAFVISGEKTTFGKPIKIPLSKANRKAVKQYQAKRIKMPEPPRA